MSRVMCPIIRKIFQFAIITIALTAVIILMSIVGKYSTTKKITNTQDNVTNTQDNVTNTNLRDQCRFWLESYKIRYHAFIADQSHWICSGALIHKKYALTLASCVYYHVQRDTYKIDMKVFLASYERPGCNPYDVENITCHPSYDHISSTDNIAVIQLKEEILDDYIPTVISLPDPETTADKGLELYVSSPRHCKITDLHTCDLLGFYMKVIDKKWCQSLYPNMSGKFCADAAPGHYSCLGGDGSPAVVLIPRKNEKWIHYIIGLRVGKYSDICDEKESDMFIDVSSYLNFIQNSMS